MEQQVVDPAFTQQILEALVSSLNPQAETRHQAELFIKNAQKIPGYCSALLKISADPAVDKNQQLAAAVQLGTLIEYHWKFRDVEQAKKIAIEGFDFIILDETDKQVVRANLMQSLYLTTQRPILKQYVRCITTIARFDYPQLWPNLVLEIVQYLSQQDEKAVMTGLLGLKGLCKKYEYELEDERKPLYDIIAATFPILGGLVNQVINVQSESAFEVMYLISKIFYVSNQLYICPFMIEGAHLDPWIQFFKTIMDRQVPAELESFIEDMNEIEERDKHIIWKTKGIAAKTSYRLFSKYGNPSFVSNAQLEKFSEKFRDTYAVPLLESHLQIVLKKKTNFVGSKTLNCALKYVSQSTKLPITMKLLAPFVEQILFEIIIPVMFITHKDITLFKDDPIEYIRKQNDFTETLFSPKNTVQDLLLYLCQYKITKKAKKPAYLHKFLEFCVKNLSEFSQQPNADWRIKEAILQAIGGLIDEIRTYKDLRVTMEPMMIQYVIPELQTTQPFLRMRALWMYGEFGNFKFHNEAHVKQAVDLIYQRLFDQELPVRLTAATSIHKFLHNDIASELLKPFLKNILEVYLKLMTEIESEDLVNALEEIVAFYKDDIEPYAIQLTEQLVISYQRLIQVNADDDDGESALAAVGCITAIRRILDSIQKNQELLTKVEQVIYPILMHSLTPDGLDAIEDGLDCIAMILYHGPDGRISPNMWKIFPQLLYVICGDESDPDGGYGFEYISQIAVSIQNYIAKDPTTFLSIGEGQTQTYIALTFKFIERGLAISGNSLHKLDGIVVMKVIIAMLENLKGRMDEALLYILKICVNELNNNPPKNLGSMILQAVAMCFWYNSELTFQLLEQNQWTIKVFQSLLQSLPLAKLDFELRRFIFGLTAIISTNPHALPAIVGPRMPDIFKQLASLSLKMREERVKILKDNEEHLEEMANKKKDGEESDEEVEEEGEGEEGSDDETDTKKIFKRAKADESDDDKADDDDDDDDSDYQYTGGDLAIYDSALDDVDELLFIKDTLEKMNSVDGGYVQNLFSQLNQEELQKFNENMQSAQALKEREEVVRKQCDEEIDKTY